MVEFLWRGHELREVAAGLRVPGAPGTGDNEARTKFDVGVLRQPAWVVPEGTVLASIPVTLTFATIISG